MTDIHNLEHKIATLRQTHHDDFTKILDKPARRKLQRELLRMSIALEDSGDIVDRLTHSGLDICVIRIALDLDIFNLLCRSTQSLSANEIEASTKANPILLGRIMRYLVNIDAVDETGLETYAANKTSKAFTTEQGIWEAKWV